jgi:hypothetical protein
MVKPLQRLAVTFLVSVASFGAVVASMYLVREPRSLLALLLGYSLPILFVIFGALFVRACAALIQPRFSIAQFALPVFAALALLACDIWLAVHIARLVRDLI